MIGAALERAGVIERHRLRETVDLAWPRIMTGFAIMSKSTVDLAMIGVAIGTSAVAGLAFANAYWNLAKFIGIGFAGGVVALVSQAYGGDSTLRARRIVVQGLLIATILAIPLVVAFAVIPELLIQLFSPESQDVLEYGYLYLLFVAPAVLFEFWNLLASRTYAGIGDTFTPMLIRVTGAIANIIISAVLIFGFDMGVIGAAIGTTTATFLVAVVFLWALGGNPIPTRGVCPVAINRESLVIDKDIIRDLLSVSSPLVARRVIETLVAFPLLWIASSFGPTIVAAYEVARRVRAFTDSFSWGFSIAASTLVGQQLGANNEQEAEIYGWSIIRLSALTYVAVAGVVILLSGPIATIFVDEGVEVTAQFVIAAAISVIFLGIDGSATGTLRGAGDSRFPFVSSLVGRYGGGLTIAVLGLVTPLGATALLIAFVIETLIPASMNLYRVRTDRWKTISRSYRSALD